MPSTPAPPLPLLHLLNMRNDSRNWSLSLEESEEVGLVTNLVSVDAASNNA